MANFLSRFSNRQDENQQSIPDRQSGDMANTILGQMPRMMPREILHDPENIKQAINLGTGFAQGMNVLGQGIKSAPNLWEAGKREGGRIIDYLRPGNAAEEFRGTLGEGTATENIAKIGERVKAAKEKAIQEALKPKEELFSKHKDTRIVKKQTENSYWQDSDASKFYNKGSTLQELHGNYIKKPTLENYDKLQSALKEEQRRLKSNPHLATDEKLNQLELNIKNLDKDVTKWSETLPKEEQKLEKTWRSLYKKNVVPYEYAPKAMQKLAEGKYEEVTPAQIGSLFTRMTKETKKIFEDLPPDTSKNILYNAIQKVTPGDAGEMAKTILDLKRVKGYDKFVTKEMEDWAYAMEKQVHRAQQIRDALKLTLGGTAGGLVGGATGAVIGAALPFAKEGAQTLVKKIKK